MDPTEQANAALAAAKKQQIKNVVIGVVVTVVVAVGGSAVLRFFGIDIFKYVSSYQIQSLLQTILGG